MKDFATEPNEEKMRKAGHLMAQKLAGSLALVTCKEPLKSNMGLHLRQCFADYGLGEVCFLQDSTSCVGAKLWSILIDGSRPTCTAISTRQLGLSLLRNRENGDGQGYC